MSMITATITHPDVKDSSKTISHDIEIPVDTAGAVSMPTSSNKDVIGNFEYSGVHDHGEMEPSKQTELEISVEKAGQQINSYLSELIDLLPKKEQQQKKRKHNTTNSNNEKK
ncbi:hypothetical protein TrLO_g14384 [Triparma laevis f. longispina]|uniref:Uncharacterized protein n=1 Tax=Triparma laevis f. longispina TaxID=1714387 RepID=A0A9W7FUU7_9STRA|nr:hypothetical protein TrLO_g14384 [Triparma laevis f. longispina]